MSVSLLPEFLRLTRQQWESQDRLDEIRLAKLRRQVTRAWELSPFYRERFEAAGFHPSQLKTLADLSRLPITSRTDFIAAGERAYCSDVDIRKCVFAKSSGSSGAPVRVPLTRRDKAHRVLKELRALQASGFKFTDRMMILWVPRATINSLPILQRLGILRRYYATVFADESEQLAGINAISPEALYTYTSNFRILAEAILSDGLPAPRPKLLITSAELLDQETRKLIARAFGTDPVDYYGSMEVGWIAWQCPERGGYHINSDCLIVECMKDGQPVATGEEGELVITNLHSDAAPLIRYSLGDTAVLSDRKCSCGRTLPLLEVLSGRMADYFVLPGGKRLSPYAVTSILRDVPGMRRFQVVQDSDVAVTVHVQATPQAPDVQTVQLAVQGALSPDFSVTVDYMESLPRDPSGKFNIVKSMVAADPSKVGRKVA